MNFESLDMGGFLSVNVMNTKQMLYYSYKINFFNLIFYLSRVVKNSWIRLDLSNQFILENLFV